MEISLSNIFHGISLAIPSTRNSPSIYRARALMSGPETIFRYQIVSPNQQGQTDYHRYYPRPRRTIMQSSTRDRSHPAQGIRSTGSFTSFDIPSDNLWSPWFPMQLGAACVCTSTIVQRKGWIRCLIDSSKYNRVLYQSCVYLN